MPFGRATPPNDLGNVDDAVDDYKPLISLRNMTV